MIVTGMVCLIALSSATTIRTQPLAFKCKDRVSKVDRAVIRPDSSVQRRLGRDVCSTLFAPRKVVLYSLSPLESPSAGDFTIADYKVTKKECTIKPDYFSVLQALLADSASYNDSPLIPAVAFMPNVALEVSTKSDTVYAIFSFASEQIGIVRNGTIVRTVRYANTRQFLLYFYRILEKDLYHKQLNTRR